MTGALDAAVGVNGGDGAVEAGAGVKGDGLAGWHADAGAGVASCACGEGAGGELDFVADVGGAGVIDVDERVGGRPGAGDADVGGGRD